MVAHVNCLDRRWLALQSDARTGVAGIPWHRVIDEGSFRYSDAVVREVVLSQNSEFRLIKSQKKLFSSNRDEET
jgi:hypothetical protein